MTNTPTTAPNFQAAAVASLQGYGRTIAIAERAASIAANVLDAFGISDLRNTEIGAKLISAKYRKSGTRDIPAHAEALVRVVIDAVLLDVCTR